MCTVTYIPVNGKVFITSNRDEKKTRSTALAPQAYHQPEGYDLWYPRDADAGGTWFVLHENGNLIVLLNGGFVFHASAPPYRKSRGLIVLDLIRSVRPYDSFRSINLENIEPFTLVLWQEEELFECRWDAERKHSRKLDKNQPHIWSSATLYDDIIADRRRTWFDSWLQENPSPDSESIFAFHQFDGYGDQENALRMNREGIVHTVSITGFSLTENAASLRYLDLQQGAVSSLPVELQKMGAN